MTNVTGQNGETKAGLRPPQTIHNEPSRVERLLSSVLLCAGLGLTAAIAALGLDADSNEARIGLAHVLGAKLADEWSPVLQEDPRQAEQLLVEVLDRGDTTNQMAAAHFEL